MYQLADPPHSAHGTESPWNPVRVARRSARLQELLLCGAPGVLRFRRWGNRPISARICVTVHEDVSILPRLERPAASSCSMSLLCVIPDVAALVHPPSFRDDGAMSAAFFSRGGRREAIGCRNGRPKTAVAEECLDWSERWKDSASSIAPTNLRTCRRRSIISCEPLMPSLAGIDLRAFHGCDGRWREAGGSRSMGSRGREIVEPSFVKNRRFHSFSNSGARRKEGPPTGRFTRRSFVRRDAPSQRRLNRPMDGI